MIPWIPRKLHFYYNSWKANLCLKPSALALSTYPAYNRKTLYIQNDFRDTNWLVQSQDDTNPSCTNACKLNFSLKKLLSLQLEKIVVLQFPRNLTGENKNDDDNGIYNSYSFSFYPFHYMYIPSGILKTCIYAWQQILLNAHLSRRTVCLFIMFFHLCYFFYSSRSVNHWFHFIHSKQLCSSL